MAALSGTAGSVVYIGGGTAAVAEISEWRLDITMAPVDTTAFGDNWVKFLPSVRAWTGTMSGNFDPSNAVQGSVLSAMLGGSAVDMRFSHSSSGYFRGTAYVNSAGPGISQKGKGDIQFGFTGSSAIALT